MQLHSAFLLILSFDIAISYKILIYSNLFGHSHIKFNGAVADTLTDAGHDVTVFMPIIDVAQTNRTALKSTNNQIFVEADPEVVKLFKHTNQFFTNMWTLKVSNPILVFLNFGVLGKLFGKQCDKVMQSKELLEKLKEQKFDLAITEAFDSCAYSIFEYLQVPAHVSTLSCARMDHASDVLGQPIAPSYVPGTQSIYGDKMTMMQRFMNLLQFFNGRQEILPETSFLLTNQISVLEFPAPTFDKIIPVGGISVNTNKTALKLEHYFDTMLSMRQKNVIISFGSNIKSVDMPDEYKKSLVKLFGLMPDTTFIWKYENLTDQKHTCGVLNMNRVEWLPQNELLADSRVDAFITHGGHGSVTELAMMGKPAVVIPIFADQNRNAEMLKRHGGVEVLHKTDLGNPKTVEKALRKVMEDPSYRQNAQRLAEMLNNQPTNAKETLIRHVEFAARFGKLPSMDPYGRHQNIIEYYLLDVLAVALAVVSSLIYVSYKIISLCAGVYCGMKKVKFE